MIAYLADMTLERKLPIEDDARELPGPGEGGVGNPTCWQYMSSTGAMSG